MKVYIPYNNNAECPYRELSFCAVYNYYSSIENCEVKVLSSTPFSRSAARNAIFEDEVEDNETVFFADADIIVPKNQMFEASEKAEELNEMVLAYDILYKYNPEETRSYIETKKLVKSKRKVKFQCSGAFAIPMSLFNEVGGYDERFTKWGCEDRVFYYMSAFLVGKSTCTRLKGSAFHLYHPKDKDAEKKTLIENTLHRSYLDSFGISIESLKKYKEPSKDKIFKLKRKAVNGSKKEILPFIGKEIIKFRNKRKIVLAIKDSKRYNRLIKSKKFECECVV